MPTASNAAKELKKAREAETDRSGHPAAEARTRQLREQQQAEFHGPTTAMLDAMQPFNIEGGEGQVHQMAARHAKVALKQALEDAGKHLLKAGDIRPLVRRHPWWFVGGAVALGAAAAGAVAVAARQKDPPPRREVRRARDWALKQAMEAELPPRRPGGKRRKLGRVLQVGWRLTRPAVFAVLSGAIAQATSKASPGPAVDGSAAAGAAAAGSGDPFES